MLFVVVLDSTLEISEAKAKTTLFRQFHLVFPPIYLFFPFWEGIREVETHQVSNGQSLLYGSNIGVPVPTTGPSIIVGSFVKWCAESSDLGSAYCYIW